MKPSKKQRAVILELQSLSETLRLNYWDWEQAEPAMRTTLLELTKRRLVRGGVVNVYTIVDEVLSIAICRFFFPGKQKFPLLWKRKRFRLFNHHMIEELSLLPKLRLVRPPLVVFDRDCGEVVG